MHTNHFIQRTHYMLTPTSQQKAIPLSLSLPDLII